MLTPEICEAILRDHYRKPRHRGVCEGGRRGEAENPACGDIVKLSLTVDDGGGRIACARFEGSGCAASQAAASLVLGQVQGLAVAEARQRLARLRELMHDPGVDPAMLDEEFGEAAAIFSFARLPARVVCATLAVSLLDRMLAEQG